MKKYLFLGAVATLLLGSCSDEFEGVKTNIGFPEGKTRINAYLELGSLNDGTRTTIAGNESLNKYVYSWSDGDAIGVFNAKAEDNTNAMFTYSTDGDTEGMAAFAGNLNILSTEKYYGYYPYYPNASVNNANKLTLFITKNQNFNFDVYEDIKDNDWSWEIASGSFAKGAAPSVAYGTPSSENPKVMDMNFYSVASYLVLPFTGVGSVKTIELSVKNDNQPQQLWGTLSVNMIDYVAALSKTGTAKNSAINEAVTITPDENANSIILNCGQGVPLDLNKPVNFWFVVPNSMKALGSTFTLTVTDTEGGSQIFERTLSKAPTTIGVNNVGWFGPEENIAFNYTGGNYVAKTNYNVMEYLYAATNGVDSSLIGLWENYQNNLKKTQGTSALTNYSDLANMVITEDGNALSSTSTVSGLKPMVIMPTTDDNTLDLSPAAIYNVFGTNNNPNYTLDEYLSAVFGGYFPTNVTPGGKGYIPTIGGEYGVTLNGSTSSGNVTLSGLVVNGNEDGDGLLVGQVDDVSFNIQNITFSGCTTIQSVEGENGYNFVNGTFNSYIGEGVSFVDCKITAQDKTPVDGALFGLIDATDLSKMANVNYTSASMPFANQLDINQSLNVSSLDLENAFGQINIQSENIVITVKDSTQAGLLIPKVNYIDKDDDYEYGYSVVDGTTSYWTGTSYETDTYAEGLAYVCENRSANTNTFNFGDFNIDLGKEYGKVWPLYTGNDFGILINGNGKILTNAFIDGSETVGNKTNMNNYSLFSSAAGVNNLQIKDITIRNYYDGSTPNTQARIAILGTIPSSNSKNSVTGVTVIGTVTIDVQGTLAYPAGGFFQSLETNSIQFGSNNTYAQGASISLVGMDKTSVGYKAGIGVADAYSPDNNNKYILDPITTVSGLAGFKPFAKISAVNLSIPSNASEVYLDIPTGYPFSSYEDLILAVTGTTTATVNVRFADKDLQPDEYPNAYYQFTYQNGSWSWNNDLTLSTGTSTKTIRMK